MTASSFSLRASMASQNRRWSSAAAGIFSIRGSDVVFHQSANASLEQGSTIRLQIASAR